MGTSIEIRAKDGSGAFQGYLSVPECGSGPGIVLLQEIFGINDSIRGIADYYAEEGYVVLVPDLFWRQEAGVELGYTQQDWQKAFGFYQGFDQDLGIEDIDAAVDFTQGIEYFNTLRRLHKPVILLEYPGENHGLRRPANQQDYTERMKEYFDHHLKGTEAPEWLEYGIPRLEMQKHIDERLKRRQDKEQAAPGAGGGGGAR
jgi:hypothetical protein